MSFPGGSAGKESACNAGDPGLIPGLGRSHGEGNGTSLQYSCLGNPLAGGAWWVTVQGVAKSRMWRKWLDNNSKVPLSMGFPRWERWSGWPFPSSGDLHGPGIKPMSPVSPALQADSLLLSHQGGKGLIIQQFKAAELLYRFRLKKRWNKSIWGLWESLWGQLPCGLPRLSVVAGPRSGLPPPMHCQPVHRESTSLVGGAHYQSPWD